MQVGLCSRKITIVLEKLRFQNVFHPHENEKRRFSNCSRFTGVFEKLRFHDSLMWMEGLTLEMKLRFQISPLKF